MIICHHSRGIMHTASDSSWSLELIYENVERLLESLYLNDITI